jgi:hypothetical protein
MKKNECFAIDPSIQILNYNDHLQLTIFLFYECYRISCKGCNSLCIRCNLYSATHCNSIATQLQICRKSFSITMSLHYNYSHNIMLLLLIFIHDPFIKFWHLALWGFLDLKIIYFSKYLFPLSIMIINDGSKLWHMAQYKIATWHINWILKYIYR